jgi:hypothetical protein
VLDGWRPSALALTDRHELLLPARFEMSGDRHFRGIMSYLNKVAGGNACAKSVIAITALHTNAERYRPSISGGSPSVVVDYDSQLGWYDANRHPSWLQFDIKDHSVSVSSCEINFGHNASGCAQLWFVRGSSDGNTWINIDDRSKETIQHNSWSVARYSS